VNGRAVAAALAGVCLGVLALTVEAAPPPRGGPGPGGGGPPVGAPARAYGGAPPAHVYGGPYHAPGYAGARVVRGYYGGAYWGPYWRPYWGWPGWSVGYGWGGGYGWPYAYGYPPVAYPPAVVAVPSSPPVYVEQVPAMTEPQPGYWYYCEAPAGYYPDVAQCPGGWRAVAPQPSTR
jgi:hypothetical protein